MSWGLVVMGGSALLGAGASYAGSKKQAGAAEKAAGMSQEQYATTRADQMPYMQPGYGAMSKLNTLLGLSPNPNQRMPQMSQPLQGYQPPQQAYAPTPGGGIEPRMQLGPQPPQHTWNVPEAGMGNLPLQRILMVRAQNGDRQAQQMLQRMS